MILSKEFYDQCCPYYQKVIDELDEKIAELEAQGEEEMNQDEMNEYDQQIKAAILKFAEKYLTPKEYWDYCIAQASDKFFDADFDEYQKQCYEINAIAYQHFYYDQELDMLRNPEGGGELYLTLMDFQSKYYVDEGSYTAKERDISFPHNCLKECFRCIESHTSRLPSIKVYKRYEEMKEMYSKIKAAEEDVEEWFKLLIEVDDDDFVKDNVEYRLGKNLLDHKLWMLYIEFLKQKEKYEDLLQVYSKYCRFFLDDFDMLGKYKSEMVEHGPADLFWNYSFDFEEDENDEDMQSDEVEDKSKDESMEEDDEESNIEILPLNKQLCSTFYETFKVQAFPFKAPLINYILQNANHRILRNLFKSCKYFFFKRPTPICYRLHIGSAAKFNEENLVLTFSGNNELFVKKTYITTSIDIRMCFTHNLLETFISSLIPRLSRCDAKYIYLVFQNLSFNDFKFLVSHGQVVQYEMIGGEIKDETNAYIDLEKIMKYFCNIEKLSLPEVKVNAYTAHALSNQNFNGKISDFCIASICGEPFDPDELLKFCVKIRDEKILFRMTFNKEFNAAFVQNLKQIMSDYEKSYENTEISIKLDK